MLLSLVTITITATLQLAIATNVSPPILYSRHGSQHGSLSPSLEKRADCGDGTRCLLGSCCGDGCAMNCCALDNGGFYWGGCQGADDGRRGCTGEATRVTVHTPYSTVTLGASATTTDAMTEVSTTGASTSTSTTTMETVTPTATATATATSSETDSSHSHRATSSSTSATTSNSDRTTTGGFSQTSPSPSPSPNPNGGYSVGVGVPVLAGMVGLGAVLL
ncbi:hypothetical protein CDV55_100596 [Aspergillus turcosus]|uniref:GPI anchored protein n=1 Tax=Aspergillus turcosus TaxID=1245748 RepID=A0A397GMD4_9EURO|nr:hypothetical protein CDV55_100596 [Aspergillus turcosus]RLL94090.1 hypothetical protein CFD26_101092 [Aspergillus turcosus]